MSIYYKAFRIVPTKQSSLYELALIYEYYYYTPNASLQSEYAILTLDKNPPSLLGCL